jgi:hypothetical protein
MSYFGRDFALVGSVPAPPPVEGGPHDLRHLRIAWTFTDKDVAVLADGASGEAVYGWWLKYAYVLTG